MIFFFWPAGGAFLPICPLRLLKQILQTYTVRLYYVKAQVVIWDQTVELACGLNGSFSVECETGSSR